MIFLAKICSNPPRFVFRVLGLFLFRDQIPSLKCVEVSLVWCHPLLICACARLCLTLAVFGSADGPVLVLERRPLLWFMLTLITAPHLHSSPSLQITDSSSSSAFFFVPSAKEGAPFQLLDSVDVAHMQALHIWMQHQRDLTIIPLKPE